MSNNLPSTNPLYRHSDSMNHLSDDINSSSPLADLSVVANRSSTTATNIQAVLGVACYAGGLFALAWWQLAHPSFIFLLLGVALILLGAKLFIFPQGYRRREKTYSGSVVFMDAMAEYLNPRPMDLEQESTKMHPSSLDKHFDDEHDFLMPHQL